MVENEDFVQIILKRVESSEDGEGAKVFDRLYHDYEKGYSWWPQDGGSGGDHSSAIKFVEYLEKHNAKPKDDVVYLLTGKSINQYSSRDFDEDDWREKLVDDSHIVYAANVEPLDASKPITLVYVDDDYEHGTFLSMLERLEERKG